MGYDLTRFSCEIHEEFICTICTSVLENPVQTPCEHFFCSECIKGWLSINNSCPVDRKQLETDDLMVPSRVLRNLLNNLDIKCEQEGCGAIIKLESLEHHISKCEYNLNEKVVCDKGCNMTVTRQEYQVNNCFNHLAKEITQLKLLLSHQQEEIAELRYESDILLNGPLNWQQTQNMCINKPNILKMDDNPNFNFGFAQSDHALEPAMSSFKVQLSTCTESSVKIWIGLTRNGFLPRTVSEMPSIRYQGHYVKDDTDNHLIFLKCKNGDVIECGIEFPKDFIDNGSCSASVYLCVNQKSIFRKNVSIPKNGFFPTIFLRDNFVRVKYYRQ